MKKLIYLGMIFISLLFFGSCTHGWEEMNIDPNNASDVPASSILINTERAIAETFNDMWWTGNNTTSYAGQVTKIQYIDESRYEERSGIIERWGTIMQYQVNLNKIIEKAQADENPALEGVALTLEAMLWQIMTDVYKAVPFTEGAQGEADVLHPDYDDQETVYNGILEMLENANALLAEGGTIESDIINDNDVEMWQKFANALHMRVAIRMSNVDPTTARAELQKILVTSPGTYPILESNDDAITLNWLGTSPYYELWYEDKISPRDDHGMCDTFINALLETSDPRLPVFADTATTGGYHGAVAGMTDIQQQNMALSGISRIGDFYRNEPAGASYFMRFAEVEFIKAEAYQRSDLLNNAVLAEEAYIAGITASCEENSVDAADIVTYLTDLNVGWDLAGGSFGYDNLEKIYYQKWISLFKQGMELWAETRRTDIPQMSAAPGSPYTGHNRPPFRWPYPASEYTLNPDVVQNWDGNIEDEFWGEQMWWDTRTGVN